MIEDGVLALAGAHSAVDCCSGIWPVFKTLAHLDIVAAGLIATIGSMTGNGLQIVFGLLADRGWRKRLIVAGAAVAGAVTFAPWAVRSYPIMGALVLTTNVGSAAFHPSATGAAANLSRRRVGFMIALFLSGGYLGYALSQVLFSAVYESAQGLTPVIALLPLAMAAAIAVGMPTTAQARRQGGVEWRTLRGHLGSLAPLFAVQTLAGAVNISLVFLLPDLLVSRDAAPWIVRGGGHFALIAGGGIKGFKFHPTAQGFMPNDRMAYPLYEAIAEHKLPAIFHTGHSGIGSGMPGGADAGIDAPA